MKKESIKRYILLVIGLFFMGLGVALTKCADLGLSTISSVPNVMSIKFDFLTMGNWLSIWNLTMIMVQIVILRKEFKPIQLLQIPASFIFGRFTDFGVWVFSNLNINFYALKLIESATGVVVLGFGISLTVLADKVMNPGEALVKVISDKAGRDFGNVKIAFDFFCVALAAVLSLIFFNFRILGIREGTLIAVLGTGNCVKFFIKVFGKAINNLMNK